MPEDTNDNTEFADAAKVDDALREIAADNVRRAKQILTAVIQNAPSHYAYQVEKPDGSVDIKFWDQSEFVHYVTWQTPATSISWIPSAYPRAFFYLGFIAVKEGEYQQAIHYLNAGAALEPTNPKFNIEKAHALIRLGNPREALRLYGESSIVGPFVNGHDVAVALRGKGFVLIEMGALAEARTAFQESLALEPDNEIALHELQYITHLQRGGSNAPAETVPTTANGLSTCVVCRKPFTAGTVISINNMPAVVCKDCEQRLTKKWWEFWK